MQQVVWGLQQERTHRDSGELEAETGAKNEQNKGTESRECLESSDTGGTGVEKDSKDLGK